MWKKVLGHGSAFFVGLFIGFFFVIAPLFAGGPWNEYLLSILLVFIFFIIAGSILGYLVPDIWTYVTLAAPSVLMVLFLGVADQPNNGKTIALFFIYPAIVIFAAFAGERTGSWMRRRKK